MRHLLFPTPPPPRPTWRDLVRARVARHWRALKGELVEHWDALSLAPGWTDPATLVLLLVASWPSAPAPGQPVGAWIINAIIMVVALIVAVAMAPKAIVPKPASLADFDAPTADEGRPVCKVFGEMLVPDPNCLWYGDLATVPIKKKGGKK